MPHIVIVLADVAGLLPFPFLLHVLCLSIGSQPRRLVDTALRCRPGGKGDGSTSIIMSLGKQNAKSALLREANLLNAGGLCQVIMLCADLFSSHRPCLVSSCMQKLPRSGSSQLCVSP